MNEVLKIEVQAQVAQAQAALRQLQTSLKGTEQAAKGTTAAMPKLGQGTNQATFALTNFGRIASDLPFGLIGIANNIEPLIQSLAQLKQQSKDTGVTIGSLLLKSLTGGGGLVLAFSLLTSAAQFAVLGLSRFNTGVKKSTKDTKEFKDELQGISDNLAKEFSRVSQLVGALQTANLSRTNQQKAIQELNKIAPQYFGNLDNEKTRIDNLTRSYFLYSNALINVFRLRANEKEIEKISEGVIDTERLILQIEEISRKTNTPKDRVRLKDEKGAVQDIITLYRTRLILQQKLAQVTAETNAINFDDIKLQGASNEQIDLLKDYRNQLAAINFNEKALDANLLNEKIKLASDTFNKFLESGVKQTSKEFVFINNELNTFINQIQTLQKTGQQSLLGLNINDAIPNFDKLIAKQKEFVASGLPEKATKTSSLLLTPEQYEKQAELFDKLAEKQQRQVELQNLAVDLARGWQGALVEVFTTVNKEGETTFGRLAKAIEETTKRILIQVAVTKILATVLNSIAPGLGTTFNQTQRLEGVLRADSLRLSLGRP